MTWLRLAWWAITHPDIALALLLIAMISPWAALLMLIVYCETERAQGRLRRVRVGPGRPGEPTAWTMWQVP